jgi:hypothetical protein
MACASSAPLGNGLPRFRAEEALAVATLGGLSACRRGPRRHEVVSERWRGRGFLAAAAQDMRGRSVREGFPTLGRGREVGLRADLPFRGGENAKGPCWMKRTTERLDVEYGTRSSFLSSRDDLPFRGGENAKGPCWMKRTTERSEVEYGTRSSFLNSRDSLVIQLGIRN